MKYNELFAVGYEQKALLHEVLSPVYVNLASVPHLLIVAPSGSGKTYLLMLILKQLAKRKGRLILADFKGIDFRNLERCHWYYWHDAVADALRYAYETLQERMAHPKEIYESVFLIIDEWSGFLNLFAKKEQEAYKQQLASILMLGRGASIYVIVALQRGDANYLVGRDNFGNCIGLGTLSKESINMVFTDYKDAIQPKQRGHGYLRTDGKPLMEIVVPHIRDCNRVMDVIYSALR